MKFIWDKNKEQINITKHGIDFKTASQIFLDNNRIEIFDSVHSIDEIRYRTIGIVGEHMLIITVIYTERNDVMRIISARRATGKERKIYYDGIL